MAEIIFFQPPRPDDERQVLSNTCEEVVSMRCKVQSVLLRVWGL